MLLKEKDGERFFSWPLLRPRENRALLNLDNKRALSTYDSNFLPLPKYFFFSLSQRLLCQAIIRVFPFQLCIPSSSGLGPFAAWRSSVCPFPFVKNWRSRLIVQFFLAFVRSILPFVRLFINRGVKKSVIGKKIQILQILDEFDNFGRFVKTKFGNFGQFFLRNLAISSDYRVFLPMNGRTVKSRILAFAVPPFIFLWRSRSSVRKWTGTDERTNADPRTGPSLILLLVFWMRGGRIVFRHLRYENCFFKRASSNSCLPSRLIFAKHPVLSIFKYT